MNLRQRNLKNDSTCEESSCYSSSENEPKVTLLAAESNPQSKWAGWWVRFWSTVAMFVAFVALVACTGQIGCVLLVFFVQANMYRELVQLMIKSRKEKHLPNFHLFYYYWFIVAAIFLYGRVLQTHFLAHSFHHALGFRVSSVLRHYVPITFALYCAGFMAFVVSLRKKKLYRYQFTQFAYCHVALLLVVAQSTALVSTMFRAGLLWFLLPSMLVVTNDCFAYIFGFFLGRTPLIRLSPKKTWEGFCGGALMSLLSSLLLARLLARPGVLTCPLTGFSMAGVSCQLAPVYQLSPLRDFPAAAPLLSLLGAAGGDSSWLASLRFSPMQGHALVIAVFASLVAPFGGFFASGFKRAFEIKDFADLIPGHGGFVDRMDCQVIMGLFVHVYYSAVVGPVVAPTTAAAAAATAAAAAATAAASSSLPVLANATVAQLGRAMLRLSTAEQARLLHTLTASLAAAGGSGV